MTDEARSHAPTCMADQEVPTEVPAVPREPEGDYAPDTERIKPAAVADSVGVREAISHLLWRLRLYWLCGWWDAGTDIRRARRAR